MDLIWALIAIFATDSFGVLGQAALPDVQPPNVGSTQIEAFKKFLEKSLSSDGTYNRYLLVSTGIFPALLNYGTDMSTDVPFYEHFKHCVEEILSSDEKIKDAIYKLLSVGALDKVIESEATNLFSDLTTKLTFPESTEDFTQSDWLSKYSSEVDIVDISPDQQTDFENTQYDIISETSPDSHLTTATSPEVPFTTDYIKFLTNEHSESTNPHSVSKDQINQKEQCATGTVFLENDLSSSSPRTESYKQFLETSSKAAYDADQTETEDYSTDSLFSSTIDVEDSSFSNSEDSIDYVSLKLWPTRVETIEIMSPSEDLTHLSQNYEGMTENLKMDFQTTGPETDFESSQTESEEASSPSLRIAKEIRQSETRSPRIDLIRGTPGVSYPNYEDIPEKEFNCENKMHIPGFYADMETRCQVFHVCWPGRRESFLCPIGTIFNQAILACDYWYNSNCSVSSAYFDVNAAFKELDTTKSGMTGPMVDTLIKDSKETSVIPDEILSSSGEISELYEADVHFSETIAKHELSKIWKFLPVKAKVFLQPRLNLEDILGKAKLKRSKKGIPEERATTDGRRDDISKDRKKTKERMESMLLEVLRNVIQS